MLTLLDHLHLSRVYLEGNQTQPLAEDLVLDDGRVVVQVHVLDRNRRNLRDHHTSDRVGDRRVDADEVKLAR